MGNQEGQLSENKNSVACRELSLSGDNGDCRFIPALHTQRLEMKGDQEVLGEKKTHLPECEESHNQNQAFLTKRTFPFLSRIMFLFKSGLQISHIHKGIV